MLTSNNKTKLTACVINITDPSTGRPQQAHPELGQFNRPVTWAEENKMRTEQQDILARMELYNSSRERICNSCKKDINVNDKYASTTGHANYGIHICYKCWLDGRVGE